jgi:hypothetical protein
VSETLFWITWLICTLGLEASIFWFIRKAKTRGYIAKYQPLWWRNFVGQQEVAISKSEDPERFHRIIRVWYFLAVLTPLIAYVVLLLQEG